MKHLISLTSVAAIALSMGCTVKTGLPFAKASVGGPSAPSVANAVESESQGGGIDEPTGFCSQEFGRDAGGKVRSAHVIDDRKVKGCMTEGDKIDMYLVKVPADVEALTYRFKVINHGETIGAALYTMEGERLFREGWITDGKAYRKAIQLTGGETYKIVIENRMNYNGVTYSLRMKPSEVIAEN